MPGTSETEFQTYLPSFTDEEAAKTLSTGEVATSMAAAARPTSFSFLSTDSEIRTPKLRQEKTGRLNLWIVWPPIGTALT
jgi:hypothetical protein